MISIITPTYNRADLLKRCFESLLAQTSMNFEWLIIDDGSTDNTADVVKAFQNAAAPFDIQYRYKENGGKHTALNESHSHIRGEYCFVFDSDDILEPCAIEEVEKAWAKWKDNKTVGRVIFQSGYLTGSREAMCYVKHENVPLDSMKEKRIGKTRDCCDTFRTELFTKYKFPAFPGERFIGENAAWTYIEVESQAVYINKIIYRRDYIQDGLTNAGRKMFNSNPLGGMYGSRVDMHPRFPLIYRIKKGMLYANYSKFANVGFKQAYKENPYKLLMLITYLPGLCLHWYWKRKYK